MGKQFENIVHEKEECKKLRKFANCMQILLYMLL